MRPGAAAGGRAAGGLKRLCGLSSCLAIRQQGRSGGPQYQRAIGFVDHPTIAMAGASPDGLVGDVGLVEVKCPNTATHIDTLLRDPHVARDLAED